MLKGVCTFLYSGPKTLKFAFGSVSFTQRFTSKNIHLETMRDSSFGAHSKNSIRETSRFKVTKNGLSKIVFENIEIKVIKNGQAMLFPQQKIKLKQLIKS